MSENKKINQAFFLTEFIIMISELIAFIYNLVVKYYPEWERSKKWVAIIFYSIAFINIFMIYNILYQYCKKPDQQENYLQEDSKSLLLVNNFTNITCLLASIFSIIIAAISLYMMFHKDEDFAKINFILTLITPCIAVISCFSRFIGEIKEQNKDIVESNRSRTKLEVLNITICVISIVCEIISVCCSIIEAVDLQGNTQDIFNFNNKTIIGMQIFAFSIFIAVFIAQHYIEKSENQVMPERTNDKNKVPNSIKNANVHEQNPTHTTIHI